MNPNIVLYPEQVLLETTKPVDFSNEVARPALKIIADTLLEKVKEYKGLGIAANQLGYKISMAAIDPSSDPYHLNRAPFIIINPEIIEAKSGVPCKEGCLSLPGATHNVIRFAEAKVKYFDLDGKEIIEETSGLLAHIFQHEIDHLNGKLYIDHLGPMGKQMVLKQVAKKRKFIERLIRGW